VLDVAAGSGVWGIALAQASPSVQVTAVDWERVLATTKKMAARLQVDDRFRFVAGDVLEANFGSNYAIAILGHILHSEGEERSKALLRRVHDALRQGGTIAIAEFLVNAERTGPPQGLIFGVNMLVNTDQGGTYAFEEISDWLRTAGFTNVRSLDAPGPSPLILAEKS
jgi:3-hydroxy-5-methyl-1-naphthoate 3-O-methyltransferase